MAIPPAAPSLDAAALSRLLEASFRLWGVTAVCARERDAPAGRGPSGVLTVHVQGGEWGRVLRQDAGPGLPYWRLVLASGPEIELASVVALLGVLRRELDPGFTPARALVGPAPASVASAAPSGSEAGTDARTASGRTGGND